MAQANGTELSLWIGGAAGDGIASAGESFAKACARSGYHVFAYNSYQSVIRPALDPTNDHASALSVRIRTTF